MAKNHACPLTLAIVALAFSMARAQVIDGTVESQIELLKRKVTVEKQIGPKALRKVVEELTNAHKITFIVRIQDFKTIGKHDILAAQVTVAVARNTELAKVLNKMLDPIGAKCVPDRGYLSIVPK